MKTKIWDYIARLDTGDFFITADILAEDQKVPESLGVYIKQKLNAIVAQKVGARKFLFKEGKWKIYLTFFPTNERVDEKYALKNKMVKFYKNI